MSVTYGFYNSVNHDRTYNAEQISALFDGILLDGVLAAVGNQLTVSSSSGMTVVVEEGRAWFNHTWTNNDAPYPLIFDASETVLNRIDAVVLEVNANDEVRANSIKIIKGTPATTPVAPTMVRTTKINQYPLAHVYVGAGVTVINQVNITNKVGTTACPFVTGLLQILTIDAIIAQWNDEFTTWLDHIRDLFGEDPAGALQVQIDNLSSTKLNKAGDTMTGPLRVLDTYISSSDGLVGYTLIGQNCVISSTGTYKYKHTHASLGARGLLFAATTNKAYYFDMGDIATTADAAFSPTLNEIYHAGNKPTMSALGGDTSAQVTAKVDALLSRPPVVTTGTGSALVATQSGISLVDGLTLRLKLHADIVYEATLNYNGTGAKSIKDNKGGSIKAGAIAGSYITVIYNGTSFILQGEGGDSNVKVTNYGNLPGEISTFELYMNGFDPMYKK